MRLGPNLHPLPSGIPDGRLAGRLLLASAQYADLAAQHGLTSIAVLDTVLHIRRLEVNQSQNLSRVPNAYFCSAPGCGIGVAQKKTLRKCSGKCPEERKPHYCSKNCQTKDWKTHKQFCKPDSELGNLVPSSGVTYECAPQVDDLTALHMSLNYPQADHRESEQLIDIDLPGIGPVSLVARNLPPQVLHLLRNLIDANGIDLTKSGSASALLDLDGLIKKPSSSSSSSKARGGRSTGSQ
ncbi:hypothetical protein C8Q79DRAFT_930333 [Trametes meyenii]|nr:hypothetical protein C8Q79DRAFT_930333 [Trametes meyenii]